MMLDLRYAGRSGVREVAKGRALAFQPNLARPRTFFDAELVHPLRFREAVSALHDFLDKRDGRWAIVRRQPIYEKDRMDPVDPAASLTLEADRLARFPDGYRHLAYLQSKIGFAVKETLPGLRGAAVQTLYDEGRAWLTGSPTPGIPL